MSDLDRDKAAFFAMIRADPGNNDTRLIFADWCDEHGEASLAADLRGGSEMWLRAFAAHWKVYEFEDEAYQCLLYEARKGYFDAHGMVLNDGDLDPEVEDLFFHHLQIMTGQAFDPQRRESFGWSCSC